MYLRIYKLNLYIYDRYSYIMYIIQILFYSLRDTICIYDIVYNIVNTVALFVKGTHVNITICWRGIKFIIQHDRFWRYYCGCKEDGGRKWSAWWDFSFSIHIYYNIKNIICYMYSIYIYIYIIYMYII
jgi:hypothetical protein